MIAVESLHVLGISTSRTALTAHLVIDSENADRSGVIHQARAALAEIGIHKSTLQLESTHAQCAELH